MSHPLKIGANVTLDGAGAGVMQVGPVPILQRWELELVAVRNSVDATPRAPAIVGAGPVAAGTSPLAVSVPGGVTDGDLLLLIVAGRDGAGTVTTPAGWTLIDFSAGAGGTGAKLYYFSRIASSEPASYSVTFTASPARAVILAYSHDFGASVASSSKATSTTSTNLVAPSPATPTVPGRLVNAYDTGGTPGVITPPASGALRAYFDVSSGVPPAFVVTDEQVAANATVGTRTAVCATAPTFGTEAAIVLIGGTGNVAPIVTVYAGQLGGLFLGQIASNPGLLQFSTPLRLFPGEVLTLAVSAGEPGSIASATITGVAVA